MRVNVKPFTHWVIYKKYTVRFQSRSPQQVRGILTTPTGEVPFTYLPQSLQIELPTTMVTINEYGWETQQEAIS